MRRVLKSPLFGPIAVGLGNDFHQVAVRVVEIDAASAVAMVDFAGTLTPRRRVVLDAAGADARQRRIELRLAYEEREVLRPEILARIKIERDAIGGPHRREMALSGISAYETDWLS